MNCLILLCMKTMETYWVSYTKNIANENYFVKRTEQNRLMLASNCSVCDKKLRFIKNPRNY